MNEPIRILHILQRMEAGGTQALLMNLYRNINRKKVQFDFLVHYKKKQFYDNEIVSMGGKIYYFTVREDYNLFKYMKELKQFFNNHPEYKVIHGHMYTLGWFYLKIAKRYNVRVRIAHSHENESERNAKWALKQIMKRLYEKNATDLFACSKEAGEYLFKSDKFIILNNAIDVKNFVVNNEKRINIKRKLEVSDKFVVGHVGRFQLSKNHEFLIDIFKEIKLNKKNAILLLIGTGDLQENIKRKVKNLGLQDSVKFLGNRHDMDMIYQAMDVFVLPSLFEGFGIVAIEAQAAGIPCLCSDKVPDEVSISPLIQKVSLDLSSKEWAIKILEHSKNSYAYKDMYSYIVKAGFDIKEQAKKMQYYYETKYNG